MYERTVYGGKISKSKVEAAQAHVGATSSTKKDQEFMKYLASQARYLAQKSNVLMATWVELRRTEKLEIPLENWLTGQPLVRIDRLGVVEGTCLQSGVVERLLCVNVSVQFRLVPRNGFMVMTDIKLR